MADREELIPQDSKTKERYRKRKSEALKRAIKKYYETKPYGDTSDLTPEEKDALGNYIGKQQRERFEGMRKEPPKPKGQMIARGGTVKKYAKGGHVKQYSNKPRKPRLK